MKKSLKKFESETLGKSILFNTMCKKILGGSTTSNGHSTSSTGSDCDDATSDQDVDVKTPEMY
ncbi:hypothetical protein [Fulvivirga imtechensis]|nr:hypothetical protein [Fulvivirga imtechensis]